MVTSFKKDPVTLEVLSRSFSGALYSAIWADITSELNGSEFGEIQIEGRILLDEIIDRMIINNTSKELQDKIDILLEYVSKNTFKQSSEYSYENVVISLIADNTLFYSMTIYSKRPRVVALEG